jgi:hypothetical protein
MSSSLAQWFQSKPFGQQLVILSVVFDPLGFVGGFLLGPSFDVDPVLGGVFGLLAASVPISLHVLNRATQTE